LKTEELQIPILGW